MCSMVAAAARRGHAVRPTSVTPLLESRQSGSYRIERLVNSLIAAVLSVSAVVVDSIWESLIRLAVLRQSRRCHVRIALSWSSLDWFELAALRGSGGFAVTGERAAQNRPTRPRPTSARPARTIGATSKPRIERSGPGLMYAAHSTATPRRGRPR